MLADARERAARLINADVAEIALATNTSPGSIWPRACSVRARRRRHRQRRRVPRQRVPLAAALGSGRAAGLLPVTSRGWPDEALMLERMRDPRVRAWRCRRAVSHRLSSRPERPERGGPRRRTWLVADSIQALGHIPFDVGDALTYWPAVRRSGCSRRGIRPSTCARSWCLGWCRPWLAGAPSWAPTTSPPCDYRGLRPDARRFELITLPFQDLLGMTPGARPPEQARHCQHRGPPRERSASRCGMGASAGDIHGVPRRGARLRDARSPGGGAAGRVTRAVRGGDHRVGSGRSAPAFAPLLQRSDGACRSGTKSTYFVDFLLP
jgi:hypothetical protein